MEGNVVGSNAYGLDSNLYTGAAVGPRGESMVSAGSEVEIIPNLLTWVPLLRFKVQKHLEKMAQEKEEQALQKLGALLPQLGAAALVLALQETGFNVDEALILLRKFVTEHQEQLKGLHKVGKTSTYPHNQQTSDTSGFAETEPDQ
jgi:hypothetical protein